MYRNTDLPIGMTTDFGAIEDFDFEDEDIEAELLADVFTGEDDDEEV